MSENKVLSREDILAMEPGRELDALVAKTLFDGKTITKKSELSNRTFYALVGGEEFQPLEKGKTLRTVWWRHTEEEAWQACPYYSADISAAWEVVEKMKQRWHDFNVGWHGGKWSVGWNFKGFVEDIDSCPEAICKAALLAAME